jgi:H(+)-transporting ATP synthase subunit D
MIASRGPAPTRSNLLRTRRRLERVRKGVDLLTRKRRALVSELFRIAAPAIEARERVLAKAATAYPVLLQSLGAGRATLEAAGWPSRQIEVTAEVVETWGVTTGRISRLAPVRRTSSVRGQAPTLTGPAIGAASREFEDLLELVLDAASSELLLRRLAEALARTSRQVNTLERRVQPALLAQIGRIRDTLEEREREDHIRLKRLAGAREGRIVAAGGG